MSRGASETLLVCSGGGLSVTMFHWGWICGIRTQMYMLHLWVP